MAILIDTSTATEGAVFQALVEISRCDPGLTGYQSDPGYVSVSYTQKNPGVASSNRLLEIAKSAETVVISGVDDTFQIGSRMIIDSGGWTFVGTSSDDGCQIYVDVSDAGGLHYCDMDAAGNKIYSPLCVTLYHELAHAYHYLIKGDAPWTSSPTNSWRSRTRTPFVRSWDSRSGIPSSALRTPPFSVCPRVVV
jgi:hypothetical protein